MMANGITTGASAGKAKRSNGQKHYLSGVLCVGMRPHRGRKYSAFHNIETCQKAGTAP